MQIHKNRDIKRFKGQIKEDDAESAIYFTKLVRDIVEKWF